MPKTILITGASSGFGRDTAETLFRAGHTVYASMRGAQGKNRDAAEALRKPGIKPVELDVSDDASVEAGVKNVLAEAGTIDRPVAPRTSRARGCRHRSPLHGRPGHADRCRSGRFAPTPDTAEATSGREARRRKRTRRRQAAVDVFAARAGGTRWADRVRGHDWRRACAWRKSAGARGGRHCIRCGHRRREARPRCPRGRRRDLPSLRGRGRRGRACSGPRRRRLPPTAMTPADRRCGHCGSTSGRCTSSGRSQHATDSVR